ncbi:zinc-binding dehydrogenase [Nocardia jiangxiensis]|uniref:Zinc-binding dehydrogenase n=1 Tax=Nocardia jiangxiensis TaxID=282685 RepID=A0ABW6RXB0_9NOCA
MRAVRGTPSGVRVVDQDDPDGAGELITVTAVSICASDLRYLSRGSRQIVGHEIAGVTRDGTPVVVEGVSRCDACAWCAEGRYNLCHKAGTDVIGMTVPGGMAEFYLAPRSALVPLPDGLRPEDASIVEPGAIAWHACRKGRIGPGVRVAVVGAGAIGILAVLAATELGAAEIALEARYPHQRELGEQFGASTPGGVYDVVIEATGAESGLARSVELARPLGTVVTVGVYGPEVRWPYREPFVKEVCVVPSIAYCHDETGTSELARVATLLVSRPDIADTVITHRFGIDEAERAFEVAAARRPGTCKVVVHP